MVTGEELAITDMRVRLADLAVIEHVLRLGNIDTLGLRQHMIRIELQIDQIQKDLPITPLDQLPTLPVDLGLAQKETFTVPDDQRKNLRCKNCGDHVLYGTSQRDGRNVWFHSENKQQLCWPHNPIAEPDI